MSTEYEGLNYINVLSTKNIIGNLSGSTEFIYSAPSDHSNLALKNSHFVMNFTITTVEDQWFKVSDTNKNAEHSAGFVNNPCGSLFITADLSTNNVLAQRIESWSTHTTADKLLNSTYEAELSSNNPVIPHDLSTHFYKNIPLLATAGITALGYSLPPTTNTYASTMALRQRNRNIIVAHGPDSDPIYNLPPTYSSTTGARDANSGEINLKLGMKCQLSFNFPFLDTDDNDTMSMYGNTKYHVVFQTNPNFKKDLFMNVDTALVELMTINIDDFQWCIPTFKSNIPTSITQNTLYTQTYTYKAVHNAQLYAIQVPSSTSKVAVFFTYNSNTLKEGLLIDTMLPIAGALRAKEAPLNTKPALSSVYVNINGKNYPSNYYTLSSGATLSKSADLLRCYNDYKRFSGAFQLGEAPLLRDLQTWMESPIFVFDCKASINTSAGTSTLSIYANNEAGYQTTPPATIVNINVVCYYEKQLQIKYGQYSEVVQTEAVILA